MAGEASAWTAVYRVVRRIPAGRVATYGQVAALAGMPRAARQVGWALHALQGDEGVPWQRVVNARGEISARGERTIEDLQRALLESEGVEFRADRRIDLERYVWKPRSRAQPSAAKKKPSAAKKEPSAAKRKPSTASRKPSTASTKTKETRARSRARSAGEG